MALIKWEPRRGEVQPFRSLREEIDRVFEDFFRGWPRPWAGAGPTHLEVGATPTVDLKETEKEFVLTAAVPGISKDELNVTITEGGVTIKGEHKAEKEKKDDNYHYKETSYGSFHRMVSLPAEVVADKAEATLKDGILTLTLPKAEPSKKKQIEINVK